MDSEQVGKDEAFYSYVKCKYFPYKKRGILPTCTPFCIRDFIYGFLFPVGNYYCLLRSQFISYKIQPLNSKYDASFLFILLDGDYYKDSSQLVFLE